MFSLTDAREGGLYTAIFALYLSDAWQDAHTVMETTVAINNQVLRLKQDPSLDFYPATVPLMSSVHAYFFPMMIGLEGGRLINGSLERLQELASFGIRYLTLTHNRNTDWADSATDQPYHEGLTQFGRSVLKKCEELGVLIDVSHASDLTVANVIYLSSKPVIASHSGCRGLVMQPRNLPDILIYKIAERGGVICVPYAKRFIGHYKVADHIDYIAQKVGSEYVGIGSDLDGAVMIPSFTNVRQWKETVLEDLVNMGYGQDQIDGILGGNMLRLLKVVREGAISLD